MPRDRLVLHTPASCSRVVLNALEEISAPYREQTVSLMTGAQYQPAFLAINPKGKVPVLVDDGVATTEIPVILYRLARENPQAGLLPVDATGEVALEALSDLVWIAGALHPVVWRFFRSAAVSRIDADGVRAAALAELHVHAAAISARIGTGGWWYGGDWSIADVFIAWVYVLAEQFGFPLVDYPILAAHRVRVESRPSFVRARAVELAAAARDGLATPPGITV